MGLLLSKFPFSFIVVVLHTYPPVTGQRQTQILTIATPPPHWPEEYAKYHVFNAFEADFRSKNKNSPPLALTMRTDQGPDVISTRKTGFQPA